MMMMTSRAVVLLLVFLAVATTAAEENLYKILGVAKTATTKEIKSAYRKKALATHPDKNKDKPPEQAAEEFHKVVHAFEILTDENSRRTYDRTGRAQQQGQARQQQQRGGGFHSSFQWRGQWRGQRQRLKDKFEVKEAQSRVMHIVSLEQLKTVMLDDDEKLERNLLMVFCTPTVPETVADDELVFPYPFAAMSSQGIWWEDLLQTVKIRFHKENDLTRFFGIGTGDDMRERGEPIILFGKRGQSLGSDMVRLQTKDRPTFETWVWNRLKVRVVFVNQHPHPVEVFWIHDRTAKLTSTKLQPNAREEHTTMLSHEWWVRDARVDTRDDSPRRTKLSKESIMGIWKITSDQDGQEIVIRKKTCFDMSGHCNFWNAHGECLKNPSFMRQQCKLTCGLCRVEDDDVGDEQKPASNYPEQRPKQKRQPVTAKGKDEL